MVRRSQSQWGALRPQLCCRGHARGVWKEETAFQRYLTVDAEGPQTGSARSGLTFVREDTELDRTARHPWSFLNQEVFILDCPPW